MGWRPKMLSLVSGRGCNTRGKLPGLVLLLIRKTQEAKTCMFVTWYYITSVSGIALNASKWLAFSSSPPPPATCSPLPLKHRWSLSRLCWLIRLLFMHFWSLWHFVLWLDIKSFLIHDLWKGGPCPDFLPGKSPALTRAHAFFIVLTCCLSVCVITLF